MSDEDLRALVELRAWPLLSDARAMAKELLTARARIKELEQKLRDADAYADELSREVAGLSDLVGRS